MYTTPIVLPLDFDGEIYVLQNEKGETIGTGTKEACRVLMYLLTKPASRAIEQSTAKAGPKVRSAITI